MHRAFHQNTYNRKKIAIFLQILLLYIQSNKIYFCLVFLYLDSRYYIIHSNKTYAQVLFFRKTPIFPEVCQVYLRKSMLLCVPKSILSVYVSNLSEFLFFLPFLSFHVGVPCRFRNHYFFHYPAH